MNARAAFTVALLATGCTPGNLDVAMLAPDPLLTGLVAHWPLDDAAGSTVSDHATHHHDGALVGGTWTTGRFGGALHFASGNAVTVPDFPNATSSWTVALWVRPPSGDFGADYLTLISTEAVFAGGWQMNVTLTAAEAFYQFAYWTGPADTDNAFFNCACVARDTWTHLAAVVDGAAQTLAFYRDGTLQKQLATSRPISAGNATLFMGRWRDAGRLFEGDLDDIAIYDHSLVATDVARLASAAVPDVR